MTLWAEPRRRGWVSIDSAGCAVEHGVVYLSKRLALAALRRLQLVEINRCQGSSPETIEATGRQTEIRDFAYQARCTDAFFQGTWDFTSLDSNVC
jgi:hypothetical protein